MIDDSIISFIMINRLLTAPLWLVALCTNHAMPLGSSEVKSSLVERTRGELFRVYSLFMSIRLHPAELISNIQPGPDLWLQLFHLEGRRVEVYSSFPPGLGQVEASMFKRATSFFLVHWTASGTYWTERE